MVSSPHFLALMRIAFVVADVARQSPTFGTLYLARAALRRGHDVRFVGIDDLTFAPDNRVLGEVVAATPRCVRALAQAKAPGDGSAYEEM